MRTGHSWLLAGCLVAACAGYAAQVQAQAQVQVEMSADRTELSMGESVVLNISVQLQGADSPRIEVPEFGGFQIVQRSVQRPMQFSFGFGQQAPMVTSTTQYIFVLVPRAPGRFPIKPVRVTVGQKVFQSQALTLTVHGAGAQEPPGQGAPPDQQAPGQQPPTAAQVQPPTTTPQATGDAATFDADAFLRTVVDKTSPYQGEQVTATIYLYTHRNLQQMPEVRTEASTDGFWTHDLLAARRSMEPTRQVVNGHGFWVYVLRRFAAFPLQPGDLVLGAMSLTLSHETIFDLLDPSHAEPNLQRTGVPLLLHVKPLPETGKPAGDVAVGNFELAAQLDRNQVVTGDAVTLTATVRGRGNVRALALATPSVPKLEVLQPETHEVVESPDDLVQGTRSFAWLIVPNAPGTYTIPPVQLDFFDPQSQSYKRVSSAALTLTAAGNARAAAPTEPTPSQTAPDVAVPGDEESWPPIRTHAAFARKQAKLADQPSYAWGLGAAPFLWLLSISVPAMQRRVRERRQRGGPREALRVARTKLAQAKAGLEAQDAKRFHAELAAALHTALDARLSVVAAGLTRPQLRAALDAHGVPDGAIRELLDVLERCDFARFSSAAVSAQDMQALLARGTSLVDGLARSAPKSEAPT